MTIKSSGTQLRFSEIEDEFGSNPKRSLGQYRAYSIFFTNKVIGELGNVITGYLPLDDGIPTQGEIKFSDFYSKKLNIVVDLHSSGSSSYNVNAYTNRFATGAYKVVGGFRPTLNTSEWQGGKKVIIHINNTFGSDGASNVNDVAVDMGSVNSSNWPTDTSFAIDVGSQGLVVGKGGKGGNGGDDKGGGEDGENGTSAMRIKSGLTPTIKSGGAIIAGGGGGGGGAGAEQNDRFMFFRDYDSAGGGGGGGGAGLPAGQGGSGGNPGGGSGGSGTLTAGGNAGGGATDDESIGSNGGNGGNPGAAGGNGNGGSNRSGGDGSGKPGGNQYVTF